MHLFVHSAVLTTPPLLLLLRLATPAAASVNSFYFSFPSKTAAVPLVHNGDVLNVTWFSEYNQASLIHWCGGTNSMCAHHPRVQHPPPPSRMRLSALEMQCKPSPLSPATAPPRLPSTPRGRGPATGSSSSKAMRIGTSTAGLSM
ncbi:hypothetical protein B0J12DRAFT_672665 [Macrophomina phaseolina]|uniref:Cupredoxin n=1 Tax=Macrophomina phaseolina TaxID=35725 RepID=A0ABQ8G340_9PEZI|nr:hypothetical protein B0J12DRAFT_672665 [Macrophomina phaseolina]